MKNDELFVEGYPGEKAWLVRELNGSWVVAMRLVKQRGRPAVADLRIYPKMGFKKSEPDVWQDRDAEIPRCPPGGITSRLLRQVRVGSIGPVVDKQLQDFAIFFGDAPDIGRTEKASSTKKAKSPRGRRPLHDAEVLPFAVEYDKAIRRGSRKPLVDVASTLDTTTSRARDRVHQARKQGLLTPTRDSGVTGGTLTEKARRLLTATSKGGKKK